MEFAGQIVDLRDWWGLDLTGSNDNGGLLQSAINASDFPGGDVLLVPRGRIAFGTPLVWKQNTTMRGYLGAAGAAELWFVGADGQDAIINAAVPELSFGELSGVRLMDKRTNPTSGRGIAFSDYNNRVALKQLQVIGFPREQIYIGALPGHAGDCTEIDDVWLLSDKPEAKGLLLERLDNAILVRNIKSDIRTAPEGDGYVIRTQSFANEQAVISISGVKHESSNGCPTLSFPVNTRGNLSISNVIQRNPQGGPGDVIRIGAAGNSASEGGGRMVMENIAGQSHGNWGGTAATIRCMGSGAAVFGPVGRAVLGGSGRVLRDGLAGNGDPEGSVYGNPGEVFHRLDAIGSTPAVYAKRSQAGTRNGWVAQ